jgi:hypothetical protein
MGMNFSAGNSQVPGITGKDFLNLFDGPENLPLFSDAGCPIRPGRLNKLAPFLGGKPSQLGRLDGARAEAELFLVGAETEPFRDATTLYHFVDGFRTAGSLIPKRLWNMVVAS